MGIVKSPLNGANLFGENLELFLRRESYVKGAFVTLNDKWT